MDVLGVRGVMDVIDVIKSLIYIYFFIIEHLSVHMRVIYLVLIMFHAYGVDVKNYIQMFYPLIIFSIFGPFLANLYNIFGKFNLDLKNLIKNKFKIIKCHKEVVNNIELVFIVSLLSKLLIFFYVHKYFEIKVNYLSFIGYIYIIAYLYLYPIAESYLYKKINHNVLLFNLYLITTTFFIQTIIVNIAKYNISSKIFIYI